MTTKKTSIPTITEHNVTTGEVVERSMTVEEVEAFAVWEQQVAQQKAENQERDNARAALLAKLGITAEEAQLLLS